MREIKVVWTSRTGKKTSVNISSKDLLSEDKFIIEKQKEDFLKTILRINMLFGCILRFGGFVQLLNDFQWREISILSFTLTLPSQTLSD